MNLNDFGYNDNLDKTASEYINQGFMVGRVSSEHRERYTIIGQEGDMLEAELLGRLRFNAESREELPAVGDWIVYSPFDDGKALIHELLPRNTVLKRAAVGKYADIQIIAANIDYAFIVQAAGHDFNINRMQRYLTICNDTGVEPIILISKSDLIAEQEIAALLLDTKSRIKGITCYAFSNVNLNGIDAIREMILPGKTYCLMGSSGVGKSSLINTLTGQEQLATGHISSSTNKGRHVTTSRELIIMEGGGILIDNPGMRELGMAGQSSGLEMTFEDITALANQCHYRDCTHTVESGCAVLAAIEDGRLNQRSYDNYMKMVKEDAHYNQSRSQRKRRGKDLARLVKEMKGDRNRQKYN